MRFTEERAACKVISPLATVPIPVYWGFGPNDSYRPPPFSALIAHSHNSRYKYRLRHSPIRICGSLFSSSGCVVAEDNGLRYCINAIGCNDCAVGTQLLGPRGVTYHGFSYSHQNAVSLLRSKVWLVTRLRVPLSASTQCDSEQRSR